MTQEQREIWKRVQDFDLDDKESNFSFKDRLARENGWTKEYSLRVIEEYKKFMFLLLLTDQPLTPSNQVDQAWHLHLIYTKSYWEDFCKRTLGKDIHHGPTKGGQAERLKFTDWYERTKQQYQNVFNQTPPIDLWPSSKKRFAEINFRRINTDKNWIIKKPSFEVKRVSLLLTLVLSGLLFISANPRNGSVAFWVIVYIIGIIAFIKLLLYYSKPYYCSKCNHRQKEDGICPKCNIKLLKKEGNDGGGGDGCGGCGG